MGRERERERDRERQRETESGDERCEMELAFYTALCLHIQIVIIFSDEIVRKSMFRSVMFRRIAFVRSVSCHVSCHDMSCHVSICHVSKDCVCPVTSPLRRPIPLTKIFPLKNLNWIVDDPPSETLAAVVVQFALYPFDRRYRRRYRRLGHVPSSKKKKPN